MHTLHFFFWLNKVAHDDKSSWWFLWKVCFIRAHDLVASWYLHLHQDFLHSRAIYCHSPETKRAEGKELQALTSEMQKIWVSKKYKQMRMWMLGAQDRPALSFCRGPFIYWTFMCVRIFSPWQSKELVLILTAKIFAVNVMTRLVHNMIFSRWLLFSNYWMEKYVLRQVHIKILLFPIIVSFFFLSTFVKVLLLAMGWYAGRAHTSWHLINHEKGWVYNS